MKTSDKYGHYVLSTGKTIYANMGLLSLRHTADGWDLYEGYDGTSVMHYQVEPIPEWHDGTTYTRAEVREIADYMIEQWSRFKEEMADEDK